MRTEFVNRCGGQAIIMCTTEGVDKETYATLLLNTALARTEYRSYVNVCMKQSDNDMCMQAHCMYLCSS